MKSNIDSFLIFKSNVGAVARSTIRNGRSIQGCHLPYVSGNDMKLQRLLGDYFLSLKILKTPLIVIDTRFCEICGYNCYAVDSYVLHRSSPKNEKISSSFSDIVTSLSNNS